MSPLTIHDFETINGRRRIISTIHSLETQIRELDRLIHDCVQREKRLESDLDGYAEEYAKHY